MRDCITADCMLDSRTLDRSCGDAARNIEENRVQKELSVRSDLVLQTHDHLPIRTA